MVEADPSGAGEKEPEEAERVERLVQLDEVVEPAPLIFTARVATSMLMKSGMEASRVKRPSTMSRPPRNSVPAERAALKAGAGMPHPAKRSAKSSRLWIFPHPLSRKK